ncbi:unnamed protein product [Closterium sp. NIES-54]
MLLQGAAEAAGGRGGGAGGRGGMGPQQQLETNLDNLHRMVGYCENDLDCRRTVQLSHFGERFDPAHCRRSCDNCCRDVASAPRDITRLALRIISLIRETGERHTQQYILDLLRGSASAQVKRNGHTALAQRMAEENKAGGGDEEGGAAGGWGRRDMERVVRHMVCVEVVREDISKSEAYGSISSLLRVNDSKAEALLSGKLHLTLSFPIQKRPDSAQASIGAGRTTSPVAATGAGKAAGSRGRRQTRTSTRSSRKGATGAAANGAGAGSMGGGGGVEADAWADEIDNDSRPCPWGPHPLPAPCPLPSGHILSSMWQVLSGAVYKALHALRQTLVQESGKNLAPYHIFGNAQLVLISQRLPRTLDALQEIPGIGRVKVNKYGARVLETIERLIEEHNKGDTGDTSNDRSSKPPELSPDQPTDTRNAPVSSTAAFPPPANASSAPKASGNPHFLSSDSATLKRSLWSEASGNPVPPGAHGEGERAASVGAADGGYAGGHVKVGLLGRSAKRARASDESGGDCIEVVDVEDVGGVGEEWRSGREVFGDGDGASGEGRAKGGFGNGVAVNGATIEIGDKAGSESLFSEYVFRKRWS